MNYFLFLIFLFSLQANADTCFIVDRNGSRQVECVKGFVPDGAVAKAPIDPDTGKQVRQMWVKLERGKVVFDADKKAAALAKRAAEEKAREDAEKEQRRQRRVVKKAAQYCVPNYAEYWQTDKAKWHKCNQVVWRSVFDLLESVGESEFE